MSEVTKDKAFDRAVDLVINQDRVVHQWTGRYIAVQTSLAVAASALLSWKGPQLGFIVVTLAVLLGVMAIILTHAMTQIIRREYEWQKKYVDMVKKTEGKEPLLYQEELLQGKNISIIFAQIQTWIILVWILVILVVVSPLFWSILIFFCKHLIHFP